MAGGRAGCDAGRLIAVRAVEGTRSGCALPDGAATTTTPDTASPSRTPKVVFRWGAGNFMRCASPSPASSAAGARDPPTGRTGAGVLADGVGDGCRVPARRRLDGRQVSPPLRGV